jgi:CheY-like chemotaxis protein
MKALLIDYDCGESVKSFLSKNGYKVIEHAVSLNDPKVNGVDNDIQCIFINIETSIDNSNRSELKAIDLIFWLRLKYNYLCPILTYGFLSTEQILQRNPKHLILHAPGNVHWRLGDDFKKVNIPKPITLDTIETDYLPYLKAKFDLKEFRHDEANWWSMKTLIDCHRHYFPDAKYPAIVEEKLNNVNNLIAEFMHGGVSVNLKNSTSDNLAFHNLADFINYLQKKDNLVNLSDEEKLVTQIKVIQKYLNSEKQNNKTNIICIDDQYIDGWDIVFKALLNRFGYNVIGIDGIDYKLDETALLRCIKDYIKALGIENISLFIIDLRLRLEDSKNNPENYTGFSIIRDLRKSYPDTPIMITSASNKGTSFTISKELAIDGHWLKSGLDGKYEETYISLLSQIRNLTADDYILKNKIASTIKSINKCISTKDKSVWWVEYKWENQNYKLPDGRQVNISQTDVPNAQEIIKRLSYIKFLYEQFLYAKYRATEAYTKDKEENYFVSIATEIGNIIEIIHPTLFHYHGKASHQIPTSNVAQSRGDELAALLYRHRNGYIHYKKNNNVYDKYELIKDCLNYLQLSDPPFSKKTQETQQKKSDNKAKEIRKEIIKSEKIEEKKQYEILEYRQMNDTIIEELRKEINDNKDKIEKIQIYKKK